MREGFLSAPRASAESARANHSRAFNLGRGGIYIYIYICIYSQASGVSSPPPPPQMVWSGTGWGGGGWLVRRGVGAVGAQP